MKSVKVRQALLVAVAAVLLGGVALLWQQGHARATVIDPAPEREPATLPLPDGEKGAALTRQRTDRQVKGQVLFAGEKPQEWSRLLINVVADRPSKHPITDLARVDHLSLLSAVAPETPNQPAASAPVTPRTERRREIVGHADSTCFSIIFWMPCHP